MSYSFGAAWRQILGELEDLENTLTGRPFASRIEELRHCGSTLRLVYPQRQFLSVRVQTLVDFLIARIPRAPVWDVVS